MWITLCVTGYKSPFCWGMQRTVIFREFNACQPGRTPYNAPPSTRHTGLRKTASTGRFGKNFRRRK
ncbi:hypothetical protein F3I15_17340, partial [Pantoea sp. M_9]